MIFWTLCEKIKGGISQEYNLARLLQLVFNIMRPSRTFLLKSAKMGKSLQELDKLHR